MVEMGEKCCCNRQSYAHLFHALCIVQNYSFDTGASAGENDIFIAAFLFHRFSNHLVPFLNYRYINVSLKRIHVSFIFGGAKYTGVSTNMGEMVV